MSESLFVVLLVLETRHSRLDAVSLSHLEILSEDLVSAPPVSVDHRDSLVSQDLMRVGITNVVLVPVDWESSIAVRAVIVSIVFTNVPSPLGNHVLFFLLGKQIKHERLVQMEDQESISDSDSVLAR